MTSTSELKTRKSRRVLPSKYNKICVFGYWILNELKSEDKISSDVYDKYLDKLHIFDDLESQIMNLDKFWDDFKDIETKMKQNIKTKKKKYAKPRKYQVIEGGYEAQEKKKRGRPRKEKKIVSCTGDDIIGELIAQAKRNQEDAGLSDTEDELMVEEYDDSNASDEEIEVKKIMINDKLYLIDDNNLVYDVESHDEIGTYDSVLSSNMV